MFYFALSEAVYIRSDNNCTYMSTDNQIYTYIHLSKYKDNSGIIGIHFCVIIIIK